jgi:tetratricopeptide (TPR) repeat protein
MAFLGIFVLFLVSCGLQAQFKQESVQAAYELRMDGEIHYAAAMLEKLIQLQKTEGGLAHYEMSRLREHQHVGGADWAGPDMIIGQSQWAVSEDPGNLLFVWNDANARFGKAYLSMMTGQESAGDDIRDAVEKLEKVLEMDPDFHEVRVRLIEIYAQMPEDMAGNREKAAKHAGYLESRDPWFAMLAGDVMLADSLSRVDYWTEMKKSHAGDIRVSVKLACAYLLEGNIEEARPLMEAAMKADPEYNILNLQEARYHVYQVMWNREKAGEELPLAEQCFQAFLEAEPDAPAPLRAWVLGHLSRIKRFSGDREAAERIFQEALAMDLSFSKASGLPGMDLYVPPGEIYRNGDYSSFLRPF